MKLVEDCIALLKASLPQAVALKLLELLESIGARKRVRIRDRLGFKRLCELDILSTKSSETLFILGSGDSIRSISDERWAGIKSHDSFALNFWVAHKFVPTHFFFETSYPAITEFFVKLCNAKRGCYEDVTKIFLPGTGQRGKSELQLQRLPEEWKSNIYAGDLIRGFARSQSEVNALINYWSKIGAFPDKQQSIQKIVKHMGSVVSLLTIAANMRYKTIVLCGVDMNQNPYFYDYDDYPEMVEYCEKIRKPMERRIDRRISTEVGLDSLIFALNEHLLIPRDIKLFVENESSKLFPKIEVIPTDFFET